MPQINLQFDEDIEIKISQLSEKWGIKDKPGINRTIIREFKDCEEENVK